eukprot:TRINITY_DN1150_c0_g1_i1.p2 TRINITY_DN1150_c0_g1~~TRINITY_DN1150_c0_g1_i1.p2  ORF type:complete len:199 (-),score=46.83 TRINITY_DN1150_c0_g1_i1:140-736(-)
MSKYGTDDIIREIQALVEDQTFTKIAEKEGTALWEKPLPGSSINCFKATRLLSAKPSDAANQIWKWGFSDWQAISSDLVSWEIGEQIDENTRVNYQVNKLPWPLWSRDTVQVAHKTERDGVHYLVFKSIQHEKYPEKPNDYVRANVLHSAFVFKDEDGKTRVYRVVQVEPGGVIPAGVVNSMSRGMIDTLDKLETILK